MRLNLSYNGEPRTFTVVDDAGNPVDNVTSIRVIRDMENIDMLRVTMNFFIIKTRPDSERDELDPKPVR